jgi:hypothetical protein
LRDSGRSSIVVADQPGRFRWSPLSMSEDKITRPPVRTTLLRSAGTLYLLVALIGWIGLIYVPGKLFVPGDAAATAAAVRAAEGWLRLGIASDLLHQTIEVFLVVELYALFAPVDRRLARQMALLGVIPIPMMYLVTLGELAIPVVLSGPAFLAPFSEPQLQSIAYLFVRLHSLGVTLVSVFWGLWLIPLGALAFRSRFAPRWIGVVTTLAGAGYVLDAIAHLVLPSLLPLASPIVLPLQALELIFIVWLVVAGWRR